MIFSRDNIMRKLFLSLIAAAMIAPAAMAREEVAPMTVEIKVIGKRVHSKIELTQEELSKRIINNDCQAERNNSAVGAGIAEREVVSTCRPRPARRLVLPSARV